MKVKVRFAQVAFLPLLFLTGCDNSSPTEPAACLNLGGTWRMLIDNTCGTSWSDQVVITQRGCDFQGAISRVPISFEGTVSGKSVSIRLTFSNSCPGTATGSGSINLDGVMGTFQGETTGGSGCCAGAVSGGFTLLLPQ